MAQVTTAWSSAEIYLQGAHVTRFQKKGEAPLLFVSQCSRFEEGQPIRGGIPIVFPWFGPREGLPQHGFARIKTWDLRAVMPAANGSVSLRFRLPDCPEAGTWPPFTADYTVTIDAALTCALEVTNNSDAETFTFENCLHTYFEVSDISAISLRGLKGAVFTDKVAGYAPGVENAEALRITSEVDRVYLSTAAPVEIVDPQLRRSIQVEKEGSASTVVWNPWIAKSQQMPDFGNEEYLRMVCVESGNVALNQITLPPGETARLAVRLTTRSL